MAARKAYTITASTHSLQFSPQTMTLQTLQYLKIQLQMRQFLRSRYSRMKVVSCHLP